MTKPPTIDAVPDVPAAIKGIEDWHTSSRFRRFIRPCFVIVFLGLLLNVAVTLLLSATIDPFAGATTSQTAFTGGDEKWSVTRFDRPGAIAVISEYDAAVNWSYRQACGPPNTPTAGDQVTAWASASTDGSIEWLELDYASAVRPKAVRVLETYNPGALFKVEAYQPDGSLVVAWEGVDPISITASIGTSEVPLSINFATQRIRIWLDSPRVPGWNEIGAVGLVDQANNVQWAIRAQASSFFGQGSFATTSTGLAPGGSTTAALAPASLLPGFGNLRSSSDLAASGEVSLERRVVAGFGWPFISLWTPLPESTGAMPLITTAMGATPRRSLVPSATLPPAPLTPASTMPLPFRPVWLGLALNTLLYSIVASALYWLAVIPRRFVTEVARIRRGACLECGYDLGYDFIRGCPECGWRRLQK